MAILVGIDEAGYGPLLGPLVVSASGFAVPDELLKADLWKVLSKSVANKRGRLLGRLLICDSKKAHSKSIGIKHLQRTTLACMKLTGKSPANIVELLESLAPDCLERLVEYPWHENIDQRKIEVEEKDIAVAAAAFGNNLADNNIELLYLASNCLDVGHYNKLIDAVKNKATVLFTATCQHIKHAWDNCKQCQLQIIVDRQGGRVRYQRTLSRMFPELEMTILKETPSISSYQLNETRDTGHKRRSMRIHFVIKADSKYLPVSLASMVSKFVRELLVANINHYFCGHFPQLKPTAGYWKDGQRFIKDIETNIGHVKYRQEQLIRSR
ncbi:hypothetical protein ACFL3G_05980 [Planctomycetota bacterium]